MDKTKDEAFIKFLEKIQGQNKADLALQALQVKYEREMAGEDNDKREEQLKEVATHLEKIEKAITGLEVKIDFDPLLNAVENQTQLFQKSLEEQALLRKISEGSLEYDKESAQYRNTSGRELTSDVSGKTVKQGGYVDFETAANRLQGQGKRVRESEANQIKLKPIEMGVKTPITGRPGEVEPRDEDKEEKITGFGNLGDLGKAVGSRIKGIFDFMTNKKIEKKEDEKPNPGVEGLNPEADNVQSSQEIIADSAKKDVELTKENNDILEQQLKELKKISAALAPQTPADLPEGRLKATPASAEAAEESGGIGLGGALSGLGGLAKKAGGALLKGAKAVGSGALAAGKGIARFAGSGAGRMLGAAAAVGLGAYTAYKGYSAAEDSKQAKMADIQTKLESGEIDEKQAAELRKEAGNTATVEKSGAVGEGTGMAAGAIAGGAAGAKLGATIGTFVGGPVGTAIGAGIGTIAGGALGAFAGSKAGKYVGEKIGQGIAAVKNFFGMGEEPGAKTKEAVSGSSTEMEATFSEATFAQNDPENYKKFTEFRDQRAKEIYEKDPFSKKDNMPQAQHASRQIASMKAENEAIKKFKKEIEAAGAGGVQVKEKKKEGIESKVEGGPGSKAAGNTAATTPAKSSEELAKEEAARSGKMGLKAQHEQFVKDTKPGTGYVEPKKEEAKSFGTKVKEFFGFGKKEESTTPSTAQTSGTAPNPVDTSKMHPMARRELEALQKYNNSNVQAQKAEMKGQEVVKDSTENADLTRAANKPAPAAQPIVSSNVSNVNTTSYVPVKPSPRSERSGSALDRYNDRVAAY